MSSEDAQVFSAINEIVNSGEVYTGSNTIDSNEVVSGTGRHTNNALECAVENLTRVELDLACCSEKLANLDILVMHVASRENDFEAFVQGDELSVETYVHKALEFDFLYGFLECTIQELEIFLCALQDGIVSSSEIISSFKNLSDAVTEMEEKIIGCEDSLNRSFKQLLEIKEQCAYFKRILNVSHGSEERKDESAPSGDENGDLLGLNGKIEMQTVEQQRSVLRMLEKSLAREMDLEKKLIESRQNEEDLKAQLQREINYMEQGMEDLSERLFDAENSKEVISGFVNELQEKIIEAEKIAENAVSESKTLKVANSGLNNELNRLNAEHFALTGKVEQLERQLKNTENQRLHAIAVAEAGREMQSMSDCMINDMESVIEDLKLRVSRAETQTESAEEKCILLSETNSELSEVINHLRRKVEDLETSLNRANESKKQNVVDIGMQTKLIADLVMRLAIERERLQKEVFTLRKGKKVALKNLQQKIKDHEIERHDSKIRETSIEGSREHVKSPSTNNQTDDAPESSLTDSGDSPLDPKLDSVRNIDARQLDYMISKHTLRLVFIYGLPLLVICLIFRYGGK